MDRVAGFGLLAGQYLSELEKSVVSGYREELWRVVDSLKRKRQSKRVLLNGEKSDEFMTVLSRSLFSASRRVNGDP